MSRKIIDITGQKFGRWTVLKFDKKKKTLFYWLCKCECGVIRSIFRGDLVGGKSKSCGCLNKEHLITHGMIKTSIYKSWRSMKSRCQNKNNPRYKHYGGRGIKICKRWLKFENFYADMGKRPKGKTLDRIDNNLGYYKENCRWANSIQQQRNKRNNRLITYKGETKCLTEWSELLNLSYKTIWIRINRNWSISKAFETPIR